MIEGKPFAYGTAIGEGLNPYGLTGYGVSYGIGKGTDVISLGCQLLVLHEKLLNL
jgi:hypothetical protein